MSRPNVRIADDELNEYWLATWGEGPLAEEWRERPQWMVYKLAGMVESARAMHASAKGAVAGAREREHHAQAETARVLAKLEDARVEIERLKALCKERAPE